MPKILFKYLPIFSRSHRWLTWIFVCGVGVAVLVFGDETRAFAEESSVPWECSQYSGEAQARCMNTLLELQQKKIVELENQLKAQEGTVNDLKEKLDRQEERARREARVDKPNRPSWFYAPSYRYPYSPFYGYSQIPPFGLYLQPSWRYPRYYGYGPGYYGLGPPVLGFNFRFGGGHGHRHRHR